MYNPDEIARMARLLVRHHGSPVVSTITGVVNGRSAKLAGFYFRIRDDDVLYINDMSERLAPTVFNQEPLGRYVQGACLPRYRTINPRFMPRLLKALRQALILDQLADA